MSTETKDHPFSDDMAVCADFETFYSTRDKYSLALMPTWQYCADERFDPYLVALCGRDVFEPESEWDPTTVHRVLDDGRQLYIGRPERFHGWGNLENRIIVCHNASFDEVVFLECWKRGVLPRLNNVKFACTADLASFLLAPRNLKGAMKTLFGKEISKAVRAGMDGRHDYELGEKDYRDLVEYGGSDAVESHDIWLKYSAEWPEMERRMSELNREATIRGIKLDLDYVKSASKELQRYLADVVCDIPWYPEKPVGSLPALRQAVVDLGLTPPSSFKKDSPEFLRWLEQNDAVPFIKARQTAVSLAMHAARINGMLDTVDGDGRSHPAFLYAGAHTLRFSGKSTSGGNVNLMNLPRKPVFSGDRHVFDGKGVDIRGMYVSDPGTKFCVFDYSQVERRFALWLVDDTHMMNALKAEGNLYQASAVTMGWCESKADIKHTNPDLYRLAKCCELGLGYGMGAAKFVDSCKAQGFDLPATPVEQWPELDRRLLFIIRNVAKVKGDPYSEKNRKLVGQLIKSLETVDAWRSTNQLTVSKWKEYENIFKQRIAAGKDTVAIRLPSGRVKRYYDPHLCKEETVEVDENGREHPSYRVAIRATLVRGDTPRFLTGGAIMENVVQATCRDILMNAIVEIADKHPGWKYVFNVYDECIFQVPDSETDEASVEIPRIMCHGERIAGWTAGMPLEVEGDVCERYHK